MHHLLYFTLLAQTALSALLIPRNTTYACNNSPDLCSKSYSQITHLGAHDSPFVKSTNTSSFSLTDASNQNVDSVTQLKAGVRLLSAQVHNSNGAWHLCHTSCNLLDAGLLSSWLTSIKTWMDANPHDVVTILLVNSDNASTDQLAAEFSASGITQYAYAPPDLATAKTSWPILQDMIANNTRLVTFIASLPVASSSAPYLLDEFTFVFENPYNVTSSSNFSCTPDRPPALAGNTAGALASGTLPLVNHFLDQIVGFGVETPNTTYVATTNGDSGEGNLQTALQNCASEYQRNPTFVLVDFFDEGDTVTIVNKMNGVQSSVQGQTAPPMTATGQGVGKSEMRSWMAIVIAGGVLVSMGL